MKYMYWYNVFFEPLLPKYFQPCVELDARFSSNSNSEKVIFCGQSVNLTNMRYDVTLVSDDTLRRLCGFCPGGHSGKRCGNPEKLQSNHLCGYGFVQTYCSSWNLQLNINTFNPVLKKISLRICNIFLPKYV